MKVRLPSDRPVKYINRPKPREIVLVCEYQKCSVTAKVIEGATAAHPCMVKNSKELHPFRDLRQEWPRGRKP